MGNSNSYKIKRKHFKGKLHHLSTIFFGNSLVKKIYIRKDSSTVNKNYKLKVEKSCIMSSGKLFVLEMTIQPIMLIELIKVGKSGDDFAASYFLFHPCSILYTYDTNHLPYRPGMYFIAKKNI